MIKDCIDLNKIILNICSCYIIISENDTTFSKFKWIQTKLGGIHFSPRCSMPITPASNQLSAYCYGGVFDIEDDEENLAGNFFDDMFQLDLEKFVWRNITVTGKKEKDGSSIRRRNKKEQLDGKYFY